MLGWKFGGGVISGGGDGMCTLFCIGCTVFQISGFYYSYACRLIIDKPDS
jgi:hypothetical protein